MALRVPFTSFELISRRTNYPLDLWTPSSADYKVFEDGFWGDELLGLYPAGKTNGTSAAVTFTEHNLYGYLDLISGTDNDGYAGQGLGLQFDGDRGILAEFIVKTPSTVTNFKMEVGLSDADDDAGAVNVKGTPSGTATDFAVFVVDTDDDANIAFISAKAGTLVATQDIEAVASDTYYRMAIRVEGDSVNAYLNGRYVAGGTHDIEGGTALTPWVFCQTRNTASKTLQLHKWKVTMPAWA